MQPEGYSSVRCLQSFAQLPNGAHAVCQSLVGQKAFWCNQRKNQHLSLEYTVKFVYQENSYIGSFPTKVQIGSFPTKVQIGSFPTKVQIGSFPTKVQIGSFPTKVQK